MIWVVREFGGNGDEDGVRWFSRKRREIFAKLEKGIECKTIDRVSSDVMWLSQEEVLKVLKKPAPSRKTHPQPTNYTNKK